MRRPPTRTCVACRTARDKRDLRRIVRGPTGEVTIDPTGRAPGRGAYVCRDAACLTTAIERGQLARALSTSIPPDLRDAFAAEIVTMNPEGGARGQE